MRNEVVAGICEKHGFYLGGECEKCKSEKPKDGINISVFKPMWYNDIDVQPIYVESKKQLKEECKKRNLVAVRLL
jgi:hypothetical protein